MGAYSFQDVQASIIGPGGSFNLGNQAGTAEEGISYEFTGEKNTMTVGSDGTPMHSLHADKSGKVIVRLLKTSPTNQKLMTMYNLQTSSAAAHGVNVIRITNPISGDSITCSLVAFGRNPSNAYGKAGKDIEWEFHAGYIDTSLGGGLLENMATFAAGML